MKGLGPAFFTKWLYFAAYDDPEQYDRCPPLILDAGVAKALGWPPVSGRWPSSAYAEYLDTATLINAAWCPSSSRHVVDYALFKIGGR